MDVAVLDEFLVAADDVNALVFIIIAFIARVRPSIADEPSCFLFGKNL